MVFPNTDHVHLGYVFDVIDLGKNDSFWVGILSDG